MSRHEPHQRRHGRVLHGLTAQVGRAMRDAGRALGLPVGGRGTRPPTDPFASVIEAASHAAGNGENIPDGVAELSRNSMPLGPLVKRRLIEGLAGVPDGLTAGWAQLPESRGRAFSLGLFTDHGHFAQIALADDRGRVFVGTDPAMDTHPLEPRFLFGKEAQLRLPDGPRLSGGAPAENPGRLRNVIQGDMAGRDAFGRMTWLASWLKAGNRYTLEQMRAPLPASLRVGLEYRDAIAIGFFCAYLLPQTEGLMLGFGAGNIFRRLNREAPMGAIRRAVHDTLEARAHGLRASGLEDHFAALMNEAGALQPVPGLEAEHGAEPMRLYTSSYSGCYFFVWHDRMAFEPALTAMRIEGGLNRFAAVSAWLERNARVGAMPIEDTVTRAEAARIDMALLDDPALLAFRDEPTAAPGMPQDAPGGGAVWRMVATARATAEQIARAHPDPVSPDAERDAGAEGAGGSEWVYRQATASLVRRLRLPYRFDAAFRSDLAHGRAAVAFTAAGAALMPSSRYDAATHLWRRLDDADRARMSADYNLRVGLMMAAIAFGADPCVRQVSLRIDSVGLEEALAEQDSAISELMDETVAAFERMRPDDLGAVDAKGAPKDGDVHGDPSASTRVSASDSADQDGSGDAGTSDDSIDRQFEDLMSGVDIDEAAFSVPSDNRDDAGGDGASDADGEEDRDGRSDDPMDALRREPTLRPLVTVTFTRGEFLARLHDDGLRHPAGTYGAFGATMDVDADGGLRPIEPDVDLRDGRFSPAQAQEEPELASLDFHGRTARLLGASDVTGLAIQRADLLQRAVAEFHRLAADDAMPTVSRAQEAMRIVDRIGDPELDELAPRATSALIDGEDTPDLSFTLSDDLDRERLRCRDLLFSGQADQAFSAMEETLSRYDAMFARHPGVPRYFNSYAERVVYNRLFATSGERTVLIPDNLFYAHMEMADVLAQLKGVDAALPHLNAMVSYAPAYPLSHMKLAVQLARAEDWDSARAACLNALRVALDRDDAAFAYYRFAYAEWMQDRFDTAAAAYIMSDHIAHGRIGAMEDELAELVARADSQCVPVPRDVETAAVVLRLHDLPVWPHTEAAGIVRDSARVCVDQGLFVPARTLSLAAARMNDDEGDGVDVIQAQFLRSLGA